MIKVYCEVDWCGTKRWYQEGTRTLHREDGPAIEWVFKTEEWYIDGKKFRVEHPYGDIILFKDDQIHCLTGPAVINADGSEEWWYQGKEIPVDNQEDFDRYIKLINFE